MKKAVLKIVSTLLLAVFLIAPVFSVYAEPLEVSKDCSLTLNYSKNGEVFGGLNISIYRVAEAFEDGSFELVNPFSSLPVNIYGITSQKEWKDVATTLSVYIMSEHIEPSKTAVTDNGGKVIFSGLKAGLYLVGGVEAENESGTYLFDSFVISLPDYENEEYNYNVTAKPKSSLFTPSQKEIQYKVVKLWKDSLNNENRPKSVTVDIFKNGKKEKTVTLSAENNWSYFWKDSENAKWAVIEKNVPQDYKVATSVKNTSFLITNTFMPENPNDPPDFTPPQTGDTSPIMFYVILMCISGLFMVILGIANARGRRNAKIR